MFVLKAFSLFQIPPLGASPGSSLGHTGQAEDMSGHAALSSHEEVCGREGGMAHSVPVSLNRWHFVLGWQWSWGGGQSLPVLPWWGWVAS